MISLSDNLLVLPLRQGLFRMLVQDFYGTWYQSGFPFLSTQCDKKRNHEPVLPLYLCLDISSNLSRALSCHNFLVQRMRHNRNRRPYELRICDKGNWHTVQDEEHILQDCLHEHLASLRTQHQLVFPPQYEDSPTRLRTFLNQPDMPSVASFVADCLALFP